MEVVAETRPSLPPKTKKAPNAREEASFNGLNDQRHHEDGFAPPRRLQTSVRRVAEPQSDESPGKDRLSQIAGTKGECDGESKTGARIITWGTNRRAEAEVSSAGLYENVSGAGVNYLEHRLKSVVNEGEEVTGQSRKGGKRKTPRIEVRQEDNKTVVKISIKDTLTPEEEMGGEDRFKPGDAAYENGFFSRKSGGEEGAIYENAGTRMVEGEDRGCFGNLSEGCYENIDSEERVYENVSEGVGSLSRGNRKELRSEANYCNSNGDAAKCDEVCNDREFQVSKNNVVSVISKNASPPAKSLPDREEEDDSYENVKSDYRIYANENLCRNAQKADETAEKYESGKLEKKPTVVEVFLQRSTATVKVDKPEAEYADDISSGDPFDSGTSSDVDSLPNLLQNRKGNVIVTIKSLGEDKPDEKKPESGHRRAESLTSSGVGVDSEESDDEKSNISCDSLNSSDPCTQSYSEDHGYHTPNSEDKTGSPIDQIDYENVVARAPQETDKTDIIQQMANASRKMKNLRMESAGMYAAKPVEPSDFEDYENVYVFDPPKAYKKKPPPPPPPSKPSLPPLHKLSKSGRDDSEKSLPKSLLRDIRSRNVRLSATYPSGEWQEGSKGLVANAVMTLEGALPAKSGPTAANDGKQLVEEKTYEERKSEVRSVKVNKICAIEVDTDKFYKFHLAENLRDKGGEENGHEDETFAGVKDYLCREKPAAITSAKGTIRGVKNRVKAGIATFLQLHENKSYKDRDAGKVVVYTTTMGIVRETYHKCLKVKQILRTLMVKFEERDVFMSAEAQEEIRDRMKCNAILVPQVFVEGQHIGDAETIERLNEMGELRTILKPYKSADVCSTCKVCGGYRLLPCSVCKGSKKSIHRNHFTAEFVALKCMNCDQVGLTKCYAC